MENIALTESTYYILLSLYHPQHGYGIMQQTGTIAALWKKPVQNMSAAV